jgi:hypothetical protein
MDLLLIRTILLKAVVLTVPSRWGTPGKAICLANYRVSHVAYLLFRAVLQEALPQSSTKSVPIGCEQ